MRLDPKGWTSLDDLIAALRRTKPAWSALGRDDLACFDGADTSGNPAVLLIHAFANPGWENRGTLADFGAWMVKAAEDAREFAAEDT